MAIYADYTKARPGWFFGLSGPRFFTLALATLPVFAAVSRQAWAAVFGLAVVWVLLLMLLVVPVRGRSATGWLAATIGFVVGGLTGRTRFRSNVARGLGTTESAPDLPGVLRGVEIHEGPPAGATQTRVALIQNHATRTWSVSARVVHPGIGMADSDVRTRLGRGLSELLDLCSRTELVDELQLSVRTVPDDGAERSHWVTRHRRPTGPAVARRINDDLTAALAQASVRTEAFVTVTVSDGRLAKGAKEAGGGIAGRASMLYGVMGEVGAMLVGAVGMSEVAWLSSPELAAACRTGFAPGDRAGIVDALTAAERDPRVATDVPWDQAGPSGADTAVRHYSHDAWNSISSTIKLPDKGAVMGALAPVLTPSEAGERRSIVVCLPVLSQSTADRRANTSEFAADVSEALRDKAKVKQRARGRDQAAKSRGLDEKLARGNSMTQPYAVATVTVPKTVRVSEFGRRLDASIRRAGYAPLRLDLSQDVAFAATAVPLGVSLTRGTN